MSQITQEKNILPVIGIIDGGGTGPELADIFKNIVSSVYSKEIKSENEIQFSTFSEIFKYHPGTFHELRKQYYKKDYSDVQKICLKEMQDILEYYKLLMSQQTKGIFRTAVNAETLYYLRQETKSIKCVPTKIKKGDTELNLLFIRDQFQGYYANEKIESAGRKINITSCFREADFESITNFVNKAARDFGFDEYYLLFLYKFHIMGIELQKMIDSVMKKQMPGKAYTVMQPDSGIHFLLHDIFTKTRKNIVVVCGNEVGDTLLEMLIHYYKLGTKETTFTSNYLSGLDNLEVLQTMHGSADDAAGKDLVNPTATLKLSAYALEKWLNIPGTVKKMNGILRQAQENRYITPDQGGAMKTSAVVNYVKNSW